MSIVRKRFKQFTIFRIYWHRIVINKNLFFSERMLKPEIMNELEKIREQEQEIDRKNVLQRVQNYV